MLALKNVNNIFSNQLAISVLPETWITPEELHGDIVCLWGLGVFLHSETGPQLSPVFMM